MAVPGNDEEQEQRQKGKTMKADNRMRSRGDTHILPAAKKGWKDQSEMLARLSRLDWFKKRMLDLCTMSTVNRAVDSSLSMAEREEGKEKKHMRHSIAHKTEEQGKAERQIVRKVSA